jgi:hypothetical protein
MVVVVEATTVLTLVVTGTGSVVVVAEAVLVRVVVFATLTEERN